MLERDEYNEYFGKYIQLAIDKPLSVALTDGMKTTVDYFSEIPEQKHEFRYAPGKWTPKDVLLHLIDTERVFMYRALQFARAESPVLQGFDQDEFALHADANSRSMNHLIDEYQAVRQATIAFIDSCSEKTLRRKGTASGNALSVQAAGYITCGHELHHMRIITERYLNN